MNNLFVIYTGYKYCEKCIMDPLALSYPLTNINIHVQYGSNIIMSLKYSYNELKYNVWLLFLEESFWTFYCIQGIKVSAKTSAQETHVQGKQLRTSFPTVWKGNFLRYWRGGGGLLWSEWANLAFKLYFKTSSQNRNMCNKRKITPIFE